MNDEQVANHNHSGARNGSVVSLKVLQELSEAISGALEAMDRFHPADVRHGINFYDEVRRFEIDLIRKALKATSGSQKRAAQLLRLNTTTLNTKIKSYNIEWRNGYEGLPATKQGEV